MKKSSDISNLYRSKNMANIEYVKREFNDVKSVVDYIYNGFDVYAKDDEENDPFLLTKNSSLISIEMNINNLYSRVELKNTWKDEVIESMDAISLNCTIAHFIDFNPEKLIKMCHLVASMTDKPE